MKTFTTKCSILALLLLLLSQSVCAQIESKGTDFVFSFARISNQTGTSNTTSQIRIVAGKATSGTITFTEITGSDRIVPFSIGANSVFTYTLTPAQRSASYNFVTGINNKSVIINSNLPVSVYAFNTFGYMADATNILPTPTLGNNYYHLGWAHSFNSNDHVDQYMVIATQNNTIVRENGTLVANLSAGEVYFKRANVRVDMSGLRITSNNPVAYFSAHSYYIRSGGGDNIFQQLTPVNTWGTKFMVPVSNREVELVRIIASQNGTTITHSGGRNTASPYSPIPATITLNAGQWVEWRITLDDNGCYIQSDKPIQVCSYMVGKDYGAGATTDGDEGFTWIPPMEQSVKSALMAPFSVSHLNSHYALVVTPTATKNHTTVSIGGATPTPLSGGTWYDNPASGMSFYNVGLANDSDVGYVFENREGLIIYGYGFGSAISYYYMAASALRNLETAFYVNDVHYQDLANESLCQSTLNFRAQMFGDMSTNPGAIKWYINNAEELSARDQLTWTKSGMSPGSYQIRMDVLSDDNITVVTTQAIVTVSSPMSPGAIGSNQSIASGATAAALTSTDRKSTRLNSSH